jgi:hypothetical protein
MSEEKSLVVVPWIVHPCDALWSQPSISLLMLWSNSLTIVTVGWMLSTNLDEITPRNVNYIQRYYLPKPERNHPPLPPSMYVLKGRLTRDFGRDFHVQGREPLYFISNSLFLGTSLLPLPPKIFPPISCPLASEYPMREKTSYVKTFFILGKNFIYRRCRWHRWLTFTFEYFHEFLKWPPRYTQGPGKNWLMTKTWCRKSRFRLPLSTYNTRAWKLNIGQYITESIWEQRKEANECNKGRRQLFARIYDKRTFNSLFVLLTDLCALSGLWHFLFHFGYKRDYI